jgi:hypothetical protein
MVASGGQRRGHMNTEIRSELTEEELDRVSGGAASDYVNIAEAYQMNPFTAALASAVNDVKSIYDTAKKILS